MILQIPVVLGLIMVSLLVSLPAAASKTQGEGGPTWVVAPDPWPKGESRYFRHSFTADSPVRDGWVKVAADDEFKLHVNGQLVGSGRFWPISATFDVGRLIRQGKNTIAIEVINREGEGGLIVEGAFKLASGNDIGIASGESWKIRAAPPSDWTSADLDDSGWSAVTAGHPDPRFGFTLQEKESRLREDHARTDLALPWTAPQPERFVAETFRSGNPVWTDVAELRRVLGELKKMGFNMISIDIPWGMVEKQPGQYDFSFFDVRFEEVVRQGFYLQVKLTFLGGPDGWSHPQWIASDARVFKRTVDGKRDGNATLTYADSELNKVMARYCKAVAEHYRDYPIVNYSWMSSVSGELEFDHGNYQDYSAPAQDQFRAWLRDKYGSVAALNQAWATDYASLDAVQLPAPPQDPVADGEFDFQLAIIDFFKYREFSVDQYFATLAKGVRDGDPDAQIALTVGHVLSQECARRNSLSAFRWVRSADCLWVDPAPTDYYPIRVAVGRAAQLLGKRFATELDGLYAYVRDKIDPFEAFPRQTQISLEGGAQMVSTANWKFDHYGPGRQPAEFDTYAEAHRGMAQWLVPGKLQVPAAATDAVYISKWTMFTTHGNSGVWGKVEKYYKDLYEQGDRLVDVVSDDVFSADPKVLSRYERIHVPCAPVVEEKAWQALTGSGVKIIAPEPWGVYDELGRRR